MYSLMDTYLDLAAYEELSRIKSEINASAISSANSIIFFFMVFSLSNVILQSSIIEAP